jgi:hypothetical protein
MAKKKNKPTINGPAKGTWNDGIKGNGGKPGKKPKGGKTTNGAGGGPHPTKNRKGDDGYLGKGALGPVPKAFRPDSFKQIRKQSRRAIRPTYKPALFDIKQEEKSTKSMDAKRAEDNQHYLDWLTTNSNQMRAHQEAAEAQLVQGQQAMQAQAALAAQNMRQDLIDDSQAHVGTVSNAHDADAFNVSPDAMRNVDQATASATLTGNLAANNNEVGAAGQSSNFAQIAGMEAKRQADTSKRLGELGDARVKVRLEQASAEAQEVARRLTEEIDKASNVVDMRNAAASQWLANKSQRLERKKFRFDQKLSWAQLSEDQRHNMATEDIAAKSAQGGGGGSDAGNTNKQGQRERTHEFASSVNQASNGLRSTPALKKAAKQDPDKAVRLMIKKYSVDPTVARACVELYLYNKLKPDTLKQLKQAGIKVPNGWTH